MHVAQSKLTTGGMMADRMVSTHICTGSVGVARLQVCLEAFGPGLPRLLFVGAHSRRRLPHITISAPSALFPLPSATIEGILPF